MTKTYQVVRVRPLTETLQSRQVVAVFGSKDKADAYIKEKQPLSNRFRYEIA